MRLFNNLTIIGITLNLIFLYLYMKISRNHKTILLHGDEIRVYYYYFLYLFLITLLVILGLLIIPWIMNKLNFNENQSSKYLIKFNTIFAKLNIFYKTYSLLFDYVGPMYTRYLVFFTQRFLDWTDTLKIVLLSIFVALPRFLIVLVLLFELYNKELHYYFYSLSLLLIPLLFKFFVFILNDIGPRLLPEFKNFLEIDTSDDSCIQIETPEGKKNVRKIGFRLKPENRDLDLDFFMFTFYYPMLYIGPEMDVNFNPLYHKFTKITLIIYYTIHLFAWGYILFSL